MITKLRHKSEGGSEQSLPLCFFSQALDLVLSVVGGLITLIFVKGTIWKALLATDNPQNYLPVLNGQCPLPGKITIGC